MRPSTALAFLSAAFATGCAHLPSGGLQDAINALTPVEPVAAAPLVLPPAPRPTARVGDTFVFGAASVRRVEAVSRAALTWSTTDGQRLRTGRDFFTPVLEQTLPDRRITSQLSGQPADLWPLSVGKKVTFNELRSTTFTTFNRTVQTPLRWECEVVEARVSQVPAGDFETFHVRCKSYRQDFFLQLQTITWDYAPSLGHYVRRTWYERGRPRQSQLAAALPGALATAPRVAATLERLQQMQP